MARKKKVVTLLQSIGKLPPDQDSNTWHDVLQRTEPEKYQQLVDVIRDHAIGGHTRRVFPSLKRLHAYLTGNDRDQPLSPPWVQVKYPTFREFAAAIAEGATDVQE